MTLKIWVDKDINKIRILTDDPSVKFLLEKTQEGLFSRTLFLPKGEYKYYFLVDGQAQKDEAAPTVSVELKDCPLSEISLKNVL